VFSVIYEDNHLIAVNKEAGIATQPTNLQEISLETLLKDYLKEKYEKTGNVFLGVIHRIDKPVSGIVLFAKTSKALSRMNASFRNNEIEKIYLAIVEKEPPNKSGTLEHYMKQGDHRALICKKQDIDSKLARLHYITLSSHLLEVSLETGRYHQIRAQLAAIGCPIYGDGKYGSQANLENGAIALHHAKMTFIHPITKESKVLNAPLPHYFVISNCSFS